MRKSHGSLAWITRHREGRIELLTQWNEGWGAFSFVGGHKRNGETFRACLVREVFEELGLTEGEGFRAGDNSVLHAEYTAWSESAKAETAYTHEVFKAELVGAKAETAVDSTPQNRWLTEGEIYAGTTHDGRAVSPTVRRILSELPADK